LEGTGSGVLPGWGREIQLPMSQREPRVVGRTKEYQAIYWAG
jgi:hypothetical protein